ncbi:MAG: hypothetical protein HRT47_04075 [Candidatus Caenarcaniphilales bacterium]|nr:hypothetical protein [Candidatus Caenarcaniphilales bacterium]
MQAPEFEPRKVDITRYRRTPFLETSGKDNIETSKKTSSIGLDNSEKGITSNSLKFPESSLIF